MNTRTTGPDIVVATAEEIPAGGVVISARTAAGRAWVDANQGTIRRGPYPRAPGHTVVALAVEALPRLEEAKRNGLAVCMPWGNPNTPDGPPDWAHIEAFGLPVLGRLRCAIRALAVAWHLLHRPARLPSELVAALGGTLPHDHTAAWGRGVTNRAERTTARERVLALGDDMCRATKSAEAGLEAVLFRLRPGEIGPAVERLRVSGANAEAKAWLRELPDHEHRHHMAVDALFNPEGTL